MMNWGPQDETQLQNAIRLQNLTKTLAFALINQNEATAIQLIDAEPQLIHSKYLNTPMLHWAFNDKNRSFSEELLLKLVGDQSPLNYVDGKGMSLVHYLSIHNYSDYLRFFIESFQMELNPQTKEKQTPLFCAASLGNIDIVKTLVKAGANLNLPDNHGRTPLQIACLQGHIQCAQFLICEGACINQTNSSGQTALHYLAQNDSMSTTDKHSLLMTILSYGMNIHAQDNDCFKASDFAKTFDPTFLSALNQHSLPSLTNLCTNVIDGNDELKTLLIDMTKKLSFTPGK